MKVILRTSLTAFCGLLITTQISLAKEQHGQSLDKIVAVVNDTPITQTEVGEQVSTVKKQMSANGAPLPPEKVLHKQVLDQLVNRKLELQLAEQAGVKVDDADLDKALTHIAQQNNMTLPQLYDQVKNQGLTVAEYRKVIREEMIIQQVQQQQVGTKISVTPQEVKDFMRSKPWQASNNKEYHLEDILITLPDEPTTQQIQDAKKRADEIVNGLHHGTTFRQAAIANSGDNKALQGGDLGWRKLPEIPSAFAEQVMHMETNDIAGPIQAPNGFHIIHLAAVRDTGAKQVASNSQVEQLIYQRKMEEAVQNWMAKIRSQAFINMNPEA